MQTYIVLFVDIGGSWRFYLKAEMRRKGTVHFAYAYALRGVCYPIVKYMRDVFATQPTRWFVRRFTVLGSTMKL